MIEAVVCYLRRGEKTLFIEHKKTGFMNGLGGKIKSGEDPYQAVIREVWEESGYTIQRPVHRGYILMPPTSFNGNDDNMVHVFTASDIRGRMNESSEGSLKWVWNNKIDQLKRWESDRIFWHLINQPIRFHLTMQFEGDRFTGHKLIEEPLKRRKVHGES